MKISRKGFLNSIGVLSLSAIAAQTDPPPTEHTVYLPTVSSGCSSDYQKLVEYPVPDGHICPGWGFVDLGDYPKYVFELTARMNKVVMWFPSLMINDDDNADHYEQFVTYQQHTLTEHKLQTDETKHGHFMFPGAQMWGELDHPYTMTVEVTNLPKMYKAVTARGSFFVGVSSPLFMYSFDFRGIWKSTDPIEKFNLFPNYPTGFFNSNSVVSLYGVK